MNSDKKKASCGSCAGCGCSKEACTCSGVKKNASYEKKPGMLESAVEKVRKVVTGEPTEKRELHPSEKPYGTKKEDAARKPADSYFTKK